MGPVHPGVAMGGAKGDHSRGWDVMARSDAANWRKALQAPYFACIGTDRVIPVKMCLLSPCVEGQIRDSCIRHLQISLACSHKGIAEKKRSG